MTKMATMPIYNQNLKKNLLQSHSADCLRTWYVAWLVGCLGFNGPLRQYFSLYRAVSQREGEREEKR